jgi:hypothetical protein
LAEPGVVEPTVTAGGDVLTVVVSEPTGAFAVTSGAFVEPADGVPDLTVTVGAFKGGAGAFTGTVGVGALITGAFTGTGGTFAGTVVGVVTEMLGTVTVPTGVLTGTVGVLTVTVGKPRDEALGTCASASNNAEKRQTERAFLRDFLGRAIHNS